MCVAQEAISRAKELQMLLETKSKEEAPQKHGKAYIP